MLRMKPRELDDLHQREFAAEFNFGAGQGLSIEQSAECTLHADYAVPVRPQFKPCICHSVRRRGAPQALTIVTWRVKNSDARGR